MINVTVHTDSKITLCKRRRFYGGVFKIYLVVMIRSIVIGIATGIQYRMSVARTTLVARDFFFCRRCRPALGTTHPPIQWAVWGKEAGP